jgi:hypothetical protein
VLGQQKNIGGDIGLRLELHKKGMVEDGLGVDGKNMTE